MRQQLAANHQICEAASIHTTSINHIKLSLHSL